MDSCYPILINNYPGAATAVIIAMDPWQPNDATVAWDREHVAEGND